MYLRKWKMPQTATDTRGGRVSELSGRERGEFVMGVASLGGKSCTDPKEESRHLVHARDVNWE